MFRPLTLFNRHRPAPTPRETYSDPFFRLHDEMNRLFEDAFHSFGGPPAFERADGFRAPSLDMRETETTLEIEAELPGVREDDLDVQLHENVLTIRGEKKLERADSERGEHHIMERAYGAFSRSVALPYAVDGDKVDASFKDGVLRLRLPKPSDAAPAAKRIPIKRG